MGSRPLQMHCKPRRSTTKPSSISRKREAMPKRHSEHSHRTWVSIHRNCFLCRRSRKPMSLKVNGLSRHRGPATSLSIPTWSWHWASPLFCDVRNRAWASYGAHVLAIASQFPFPIDRLVNLAKGTTFATISNQIFQKYNNSPEKRLRQKSCCGREVSYALIHD